MTIPTREAGTRLKLGPMTGLTTDPYWLTITAISADGDMTIADEEGFVYQTPAAIWQEEYEPRVLEVEEPGQNPDEPPEPEGWVEPDEQPEEPPQAELTCPASNAIDYVARNAAQNATAADNPGIDPTDHDLTPLEQLADMVNRKFNCKSMARKFQQEADDLDGQIEDLLLKVARHALVEEKPAPVAPVSDPLTAALGEAVEERAPQGEPVPLEDNSKTPFGKLTLPPGMVALCPTHMMTLVRGRCQKCDAEAAAIPTSQAQAIGESVAAQVKEEAATDEYDTVSRCEMNRTVQEVRGISANQAARLGSAGIKTLAQFCQAVEEKPADWWGGIKYITKEKAEQIEQAVEDHWLQFKKKYGRV